MARPKRTTAIQNLAETIKDVARQQMAIQGTAGLSLRAIARELAITAPAIYNYYPRLDDLITALLIDAFNALATAMQDAAQAATSLPLRAQLRAILLAYRQWALDHPVDYQLIYGNPIPGYVAPAAVTAPLARRPFEVVVQLLLTAMQDGRYQLPVLARPLPPSIDQHIAAWKAQTGFPGPEAILYTLAVCWTRIHGLVVLEIFHHTQPMLGDTAAFYAHEIEDLLSQLGVNNTPGTELSGQSNAVGEHF